MARNANYFETVPKFGLTNVFKYVGKYTTKHEEPSIIETSKFDFADCGKTIYIRTEQDE